MEMTRLAKLGLACWLLLQLARPSWAYYNRTLFKSIVYHDNSNDDAVGLRTQELLKRSGYDYEEHYVVADDGYITQLIRIINPLVERRLLRQPPIILCHGASIDTSAFLYASSKQHHPEKYPRGPEDGPITSSNRSLGFTLANNGYDVWLAGQRGSNEDNQAYTDQVNLTRQSIESFKPQKSHLAFAKTPKYWQYDIDNIIEFDHQHQFDRVRQLTGSLELSIFSYSLSTSTTMAFLATRPEYARRVRNYIQMAPAIAADHFTFFAKVYFEKICPLMPTRGTGFTPTFLVHPFFMRSVMELSKVRRLRYGLLSQLMNFLYGPSPLYQTNLERNVMARVFQPISFKSAQHYCQNARNKFLTKFNYGKLGNIEHYGQQTPPRYNTSVLEVQNWIVIWATSDSLADATTVDRLIKSTRTPKPVKQIICPGFNHADLLAGVENDQFVHLPLLRMLE